MHYHIDTYESVLTFFLVISRSFDLVHYYLHHAGIDYPERRVSVCVYDMVGPGRIGRRIQHQTSSNENLFSCNFCEEANLFPGKAPKTAKVFSCLEATWVLRKAKSWERKFSRDSGNSLVEREDRCHCIGDKSTMTDR